MTPTSAISTFLSQLLTFFCSSYKSAFSPTYSITLGTLKSAREPRSLRLIFSAFARSWNMRGFPFWMCCARKMQYYRSCTSSGTTCTPCAQNFTLLWQNFKTNQPYFIYLHERLSRKISISFYLNLNMLPKTWNTQKEVFSVSVLAAQYCKLLTSFCKTVTI